MEAKGWGRSRRKGMGMVEWGVVFGVIIALLTMLQTLIRRPIAHTAVGMANYLLWNNSTAPEEYIDGDADTNQRANADGHPPTLTPDR